MDVRCNLTPRIEIVKRIKSGILQELHEERFVQGVGVAPTFAFTRMNRALFRCTRLLSCLDRRKKQRETRIGNKLRAAASRLTVPFVAGFGTVRGFQRRAAVLQARKRRRSAR